MGGLIAAGAVGGNDGVARLEHAFRLKVASHDARERMRKSRVRDVAQARAQGLINDAEAAQLDVKALAREAEQLRGEPTEAAPRKGDPIAALLVSTGHLATGADGNIAVPTWVEFSAYGAIALGTIWGGWKIIETMEIGRAHV